MASPPAAGEEKKEEKAGGKSGRLSDEDKQTIYGLLHQGQSQNSIRGMYGSGKNDSIAKMADELEKGEVTYFERQWMKAEERDKHDTSKAGESAAKAAATAVIGTVTTDTAQRAVQLQAELMKLGKETRESYIGAATQDALAIPEFLQKATDFYLMYKETV